MTASFHAYKRHALFLLVLVFCINTSFAQLGIQVGWNTSGYKLTRSGTHEKRAWNWGLNAGLLYRVGGKHLCLQPTLLYSQKGATNNNNGSTYVPGILKYKNKLNYLEFSMPLIIKASLGISKCSFDFGAGPYISSLLSAVSKAEDLDGNTKKTNFKIGTASTDDFKRRDLGLSIYMGAKLSHFNMCLGYDIGFSNISPKTNETVKNGCFSINMGVFF